MDATAETKTQFLERLAKSLRPTYTPPKIRGGHDYTHIERMIALGEKIKAFLEFDWDEYVAACWLHNLDRFPFRRAPLDVCQECKIYLESSPFDEEARRRIIKAVLLHEKKDDEPGDSTLLTALRIADRLDRMGPSGILSIAAFRGDFFPLYDSRNPFGYGGTENSLGDVYNGLFQVAEWYAMLTYDEARALAKDGLRFFLNFMRAFGTEISERHGVENCMEDDIRRALGPYYDEFRP